MRVFNLRLTDKQYQLAETIAKNQSKPMSQVLREAINFGLQPTVSQPSGNTQVPGVPTYEILSTRAAVETLILLRKLAESSSPDIVEAAKQLATERLEQEDLTKIVNP